MKSTTNSTPTPKFQLNSQQSIQCNKRKNEGKPSEAEAKARATTQRKRNGAIETDWIEAIEEGVR